MKKLLLGALLLLSMLSYGQRYYPRTYYPRTYYHKYYPRTHYYPRTLYNSSHYYDLKSIDQSTKNNINKILIKENISYDEIKLLKLFKKIYSRKYWKLYMEEQLTQLKTEMIEGIYTHSEIENKIKNGLEIGIFSINGLKTLYNICQEPCIYNSILDKYCK